MKKAYIIEYKPKFKQHAVTVYAPTLEEAREIFEEELARCGAFLYSHEDSVIVEAYEATDADSVVEYNNPANTGESKLMTFLRQDTELQGDDRGLPPLP